MKLTVLLLLFVMVFSLSGCVTSPPAPTSAPVIPSATAVVLPTETMIPSPTATAVPPTATAEVKLQRAQIGFYRPMNLSYDPALWNAVTEENYKNKAGEQVYRLVRVGNEDCVMQENLGRGIGPDWEQRQVDMTLGDQQFRVYQWTYKLSGNPELVIYESGEYRIEVAALKDSLACLAEAEQVLAQTKGNYQ